MNSQVNRRARHNIPQSNPQGLRLFLGLIPVILLLLSFFFLRLVNIAEFPFFVDETRHIGRARIIWSFSDIHVSTTPGKFLLYYWMGAFGIPANAAQWLSRTSVVIFSILGAAGTFALARLLFSRASGLLALAILNVFPFMLFYERLALSDPMTASLVIVTTWWSVIVARRSTYLRAIALGLLLSVMMMGKILTVPLLILPVLSILLVSPYTHQVLNLRLYKMPKAAIQLFKETYLSYLILIFTIFGVIWGILMLFYVVRVQGDPEGVRPIVDKYLYSGLETNLGLHQQQSNPMVINVDRIIQGIFYMWKPLLVFVVVVSLPALWRHQRSTALFLLSIIIGLWVPLVVVAGQLSTRYLTLVGHLCVVLIAGGIWALRRDLQRYVAHKRIPRHLVWLPIIVIGIWITGVGIPFWRTLIDDPTALALPARDRHEYFRNQTGYAIRDILETVETLPPISAGAEVPVVAGMVRNCSYLPYHSEATRHYDLECPLIGHDLPERPHEDLNAMLEHYGSIYVMVEEFDPLSSSPQILYWCLIAGDERHITTYQRPFNGVHVSLYEVNSMSLLDKVPTCWIEWVEMGMGMENTYQVISSNN